MSFWGLKVCCYFIWILTLIPLTLNHLDEMQIMKLGVIRPGCFQAIIKWGDFPAKVNNVLKLGANQLLDYCLA